MPDPKLARLSEELKALVAKDPSLKAKLASETMMPGTVNALIEGALPIQVVTMHLKRIEKITGLDVGQLIFEGAKLELGKSAEMLANVRTHEDLIEELREIASVHGKMRVAKSVGVAPETFGKWLRGKRRITLGLTTVLKRLVEYRQGVLPTVTQPVAKQKAAPQRQKTEPMPQEASKDREAAMSCISAIHSAVNALTHLCTGRDLLYDGDRARVIGIIGRLLQACEITSEAIKRLNEMPRVTDPELVSVLEIIAKSTGTKGGKRG